MRINARNEELKKIKNGYIASTKVIPYTFFGVSLH